MTEPAGGQAVDDGYGVVTARYYDDTYAHVRRVDDVGFYRKLALAAGAPVLELGCGTGRVLLPIAETGIPCTGVDGSQAMLDALAQRNTVPTLRLVCARMQEFDLGDDRFGLIFSAFRAFQHLVEVEDQLACLERARRHLAPGGCLAFDVFAPRLDRIALEDEPEKEDARFEQGGDEIVRLTSVRRDLARQVMEVRMRYERHRDGAPVSSDEVTFSMRYFFRYELEHLLALAGFGDVEILGAFDGRPYDYVSGEQIVVARA